MSKGAIEGKVKPDITYSLERTMGDTQKSQTISMKNQEIVLQPNHNSETSIVKQPLRLEREPSFTRIRVLAQKNPEMVFISLAHRIDIGLLRTSFHEIRKSKAAGVDEMTAKEYAGNLDTNLYNLYERLSGGKYVATPVKRIWIEKEGGKLRPIGIPALEDKIVQKAVSKIMYVIYDVNFYEFSFGFRNGHSQHMAINYVREQCRKNNINWIVDADISGFFDNIDKRLLCDFIKQRINDGGILRLIGKWLNAGVSEDGEIYYPEKGTPQGGVISPLLSNIFLHHVLDEWFIKEVQPLMKGRSFIARFADDFVLGFESKEDAQRVMEVLPKRFARYALSLNSDKTSLVAFGKPARTRKKRQDQRHI